jgi:iron-sulfur cluster insertion protein
MIILYHKQRKTQDEKEFAVIEITDTAKKHIKELLDKKPGYGIRVYVSGGGCHGFQYGINLEDVSSETDTVIEEDGFKIFMDEVTIGYMEGAKIDYLENLYKSGFTIKNPNAKSSCGCGSSFSV